MNFRYSCKKLTRRGGFSLAEVIVAVGILALMMTLAGEVLSLTVTATGRAQALTEVNQAIRVFERTLRNDLAAIDRDTSVMLIQANPMNAYWTQDQKDADDDGDPEAYPHARDPVRNDPATEDRLERPRADLLMFFTNRKEVTNYVRYQYPAQTPPVPRELRQGVSSTVQQVVYGHAELGEYVPADEDAEEPYVFEPDLTANPAGTMYPDLLEENNIAPVPAAGWHLARRSLLFVPFFAPDTVAGTPAWMGVSFGARAQLLDPTLSNTVKWAGLQSEFDLDGDGAKDGLPALLNQDAVLLGATDVMADYELFSEFFSIFDLVGNCALPPIFPVPGPGVVPVKRSRLDPAPPPLYANRLGHYFLPNCASFKIEWALDPGSTFVGGRLEGERQLFWFDPGWVDPEDPTDPPDEPGEGPLGRLTATIEQVEEDWDDLPDLNPRWQRLTRLHEDLLGQGIQGPYSLQQRFGGTDPVTAPAWNSCGYGNGDRANMAFFAASGRDTDDRVVRAEIFPRVLRVTVDLYDDQRRLGRPIRHVIIAKVGG